MQFGYRKWNSRVLTALVDAARCCLISNLVCCLSFVSNSKMFATSAVRVADLSVGSNSQVFVTSAVKFVAFQLVQGAKYLLHQQSGLLSHLVQTVKCLQQKQSGLLSYQLVQTGKCYNVSNQVCYLIHLFECIRQLIYYQHVLSHLKDGFVIWLAQHQSKHKCRLILTVETFCSAPQAACHHFQPQQTHRQPAITFNHSNTNTADHHIFNHS